MRIPHRSPTRLTTVAVALVVLVALAGGCRYETVDGVGTRTADAEFPPQSDVALVSCRPGDWSRWHATATVTNNTPEVQTYEVTVGFYAGDVRLAERAHWVRALRPGETAQVDPSWWIESPERVDDCRVLTVNRWA